MLAFNGKAAEEIREHLPDDLAGAHVATFHASGRQVLAEAGAAPTMSKLAQLVRVIDGSTTERGGNVQGSGLATNPCVRDPSQLPRQLHRYAYP